MSLLCFENNLISFPVENNHKLVPDITFHSLFWSLSVYTFILPFKIWAVLVSFMPFGHTSPSLLSPSFKSYNVTLNSLLTFINYTMCYTFLHMIKLPHLTIYSVTFLVIQGSSVVVLWPFKKCFINYSWFIKGVPKS